MLSHWVLAANGFTADGAFGILPSAIIIEKNRHHYVIPRPSRDTGRSSCYSSSLECGDYSQLTVRRDDIMDDIMDDLSDSVRHPR